MKALMLINQFQKQKLQRLHLIDFKFNIFFILKEFNFYIISNYFN